VNVAEQQFAGLWPLLWPLGAALDALCTLGARAKRGIKRLLFAGFSRSSGKLRNPGIDLQNRCSIAELQGLKRRDFEKSIVSTPIAGCDRLRQDVYRNRFLLGRAGPHDAGAARYSKSLPCWAPLSHRAGDWPGRSRGSDVDTIHGDQPGFRESFASKARSQHGVDPARAARESHSDGAVRGDDTLCGDHTALNDITPESPVSRRLMGRPRACWETMRSRRGAPVPSERTSRRADLSTT
jgi:hypothetical protein